MEKQWNRVLDVIKDQLSAANYRTWFASTSASLTSEGNLVISTPSTFVKNQLSARYLALIQSSLQQVTGRSYNIEFKVDSTLSGKDSEATPELEFQLPAPPTHPGVHINLNPKHTLANFVVGLSNNLAFAAAQAVSQNPGISYNPLFIYGGTGVGKTHLMQGVGNALLEKNPHLKIIYCSSETFTNDFIQSIQTKRTGDFRARYRSADLLLIDDIQFISGRDSTQEEFFHTFNELQAKNSQIILTSDRPPNEMVELEARLKSRFQGGLMVDIQPPDFDTRVAILRAKCLERNEAVPEEILTLIASVMATNARELEGKLIQVIQTAKLTHQPLNESTVRGLLGKPTETNQKLDYKQVINSINEYFNIKMADLTGPRRKKELVVPRQLAMYLLYEECKLPYERIGQVLGGRDHTTILHGVEKIKEASVRDREIQRLLIELKQAITS